MCLFSHASSNLPTACRLSFYSQWSNEKWLLLDKYSKCWIWSFHNKSDPKVLRWGSLISFTCRKVGKMVSFWGTKMGSGLDVLYPEAYPGCCMGGEPFASCPHITGPKRRHAPCLRIAGLIEQFWKLGMQSRPGKRGSQGGTEPGRHTDSLGCCLGKIAQATAKRSHTPQLHNVMTSWCHDVACNGLRFTQGHFWLYLAYFSADKYQIWEGMDLDLMGVGLFRLCLISWILSGRFRFYGQ